MSQITNSHLNFNIELQKLKDIIQKPELELVEKKKTIDKLRRDTNKAKNNISLLYEKQAKILENQATKKNKLNLVKKEVKLKKSYLENLYSNKKSGQDKELNVIRNNINLRLDLSIRLIKLINNRNKDGKAYQGLIPLKEDSLIFTQK